MNASSKLNVQALESRDAMSAGYITVTNGQMTIYGSDVKDVVSITASGSNIVAELKHATGSNTYATDVVRTVAASSISKIIFHGYDGNDIFTNNTSEPTQVYGGSGNDSLASGSGIDYLCGGIGNDTVKGGANADVLHGDAGNDVLYGGSGNDRLFGDAGIDILYGDADNDWLEAGSVTETVSDTQGKNWNAHLWTKSGTTASDINQQSSPTCVFLSCLAGAADKGYNLNSRITYLGDYKYQVQLYLPNVGMALPSNEIVYFDGAVTNQDPGTAGSEYWTTLYQRGYLQMCERFGIDFHDFDVALSSITGRTALDCQTLASPELLAPLLNAGMVGAAGTHDASGMIINDHAYTIMKLEQTNGVWYVTLRNPWGVDGGTTASGDASDGIVKMTWNSFRNVYNFSAIWLA